MSTTIHKILVHGGSVIKDSILPIGQSSKEAAEARNKHFREYRYNFARKFNRTECNKHILNRLILTSDSLFSNVTKISLRKRKLLSKEAIVLLKEPKLKTHYNVIVNVNFFNPNKVF